MKIKTLKGISQDEVLNAFNLSFSDYFVKFQLSKEQFNLKVFADKLNFDLSVGVFDKDKLVAFILHGVDTVNKNQVVYNGGTGVIPKMRGKGLTKEMYHYVLPILKEQGINHIQLEVISENIQAIKSYENSGFKAVRQLVCYNGTIKTIETNNYIEIKKTNEYKWEFIETFWDILPTWQNSKNIINNLINSHVFLGAYLQNRLVGYLIYNAKGKRLKQIAIDKKFRRRKIASTLMHELAKEFGDSISVINVDKSNHAINIFLKKVGLINSIEQIEMILQLNKSNTNNVVAINDPKS